VRVIPITMWVVSKNESNCLLENKMISSLVWKHVRLLYVVQSNILWLTIVSYHYRCNIIYMYVINPSFFSFCTFNQIITVNRSTNAPITKK